MDDIKAATYDFDMALITEADVFSRLIDASNPTLTPEAAAGILQLGCSEALGPQ